MKAIETFAYGCRFRSRLEARWAVFFSTLGLSWDYEPEGFSLPNSGCYLPDFFVRGFPGKPDKIWIEVKATPPLDYEVNKLRELCCISQTHGFFAIGNDLDREYMSFMDCPFKEIIECARLYRLPDSYESNQGCFAPYPRPLRYWQAPHSIEDFYPIGSKVPEYDTPEGERFRELHHALITESGFDFVLATSLEAAASASLSARFEHGDAGCYPKCD